MRLWILQSAGYKEGIGVPHMSSLLVAPKVSLFLHFLANSSTSDTLRPGGTVRHSFPQPRQGPRKNGGKEAKTRA